MQQQSVEALLHGAAKGAKGVFERGEKLGINQAVRDAVGEIKRNINEARQNAMSPRQVLQEEGAVRGLVALERRNQQLAAMLDETVNNLRALSATNLDDKAKSLELIEIAAAKVQFVKIYLEDSSMEVPTLDSPPPEDSPQSPISDEIVHMDEPDSRAGRENGLPASTGVDIAGLKISEDKDEKACPLSPDRMDTSGDGAAAGLQVRPSGPNPTRSTLAQSSFSWMLEPDETASPQAPVMAKKSPSKQKKRISNSISRERNAFLFGEVTTKAENPLSSEEIFGLQPMEKEKSA